MDVEIIETPDHNHDGDLKMKCIAGGALIEKPPLFGSNGE